MGSCLENLNLTKRPSTLNQHVGKEKAKEKKVTWNKNLFEIKNISPRVKKESFKFPSSNFIRNLHIEKSIPANQLNCSPQLKHVVFQSFQSKDNHWMERRKDLTLQFDGNTQRRFAHFS